MTQTPEQIARDTLRETCIKVLLHLSKEGDVRTQAKQMQQAAELALATLGESR